MQCITPFSKPCRRSRAGSGRGRGGRGSWRQRRRSAARRREFKNTKLEAQTKEEKQNTCRIYVSLFPNSFYYDGPTRIKNSFYGGPTIVRILTKSGVSIIRILILAKTKMIHNCFICLGPQTGPASTQLCFVVFDGLCGVLCVVV